jgi:hypothetical protein
MHKVYMVESNYINILYYQTCITTAYSTIFRGIYKNNKLNNTIVEQLVHSEPQAPNYSRVALTRGGVGSEGTPYSVAWCYICTPWMVRDERGGEGRGSRVKCGLIRDPHWRLIAIVTGARSRQTT